MKRPAKEDAAYPTWALAVFTRLEELLSHHPLLVIRATSWMTRVGHFKQMGLERTRPPVKVLYSRIGHALNAGKPLPAEGVQIAPVTPDDIRRAADWIRSNPIADRRDRRDAQAWAAKQEQELWSQE